MFVLFLLFSNYNSSHEVLKDAEKVLKTSPIGAVKHQCFHCAAAKLELAFGASLAIANAYMDSYISTQSAQRQPHFQSSAYRTKDSKARLIDLCAFRGEKNVPKILRDGNFNRFAEWIGMIFFLRS